MNKEGYGKKKTNLYCTYRLIVVPTVRHVLYNHLLTNSRARTIDGQLKSARNHLMCCDGITVGLGLPEDGVKRHTSAYERKLIRELINAV